MRLTNAGAALLAKAIAGRTLEFTRGAFGDALNGSTMSNPSLTEQAALTALIHEKLSLPIIDVTTEQDNAIVQVQASNSGVTSDFRIAEIGLFARGDSGEVLYGYCFVGSEGDMMPASSSAFSKDFVYEINIVVSNAVNVTAVINRSGGDGSYVLPTASTSTKGGVKVGSGLQMNGETLNCTVSGGGTYTLPTASTSTKGGVKVGSGLQMNGETLSFSNDLSQQNVTVQNATVDMRHTTIVASDSTADTLSNLHISGAPVFDSRVSIDGMLSLAGDLYAERNVRLASERATVQLAKYTDIEGEYTTVTGAVHFYGTPTFHNGANGLPSGASDYTLPTASSTVKGGVKVGSGLAISQDSLSVNVGYGLRIADGFVTLEQAEANAIGGVKIGNGVTVNNLGQLERSNNFNDETVQFRRAFLQAESLTGHLGYATVNAANAQISLKSASLVTDTVVSNPLFVDGMLACTRNVTIQGELTAQSSINITKSNATVSFADKAKITFNGNASVNLGNNATVNASGDTLNCDSASINANSAQINAINASVTTNDVTEIKGNLRFTGKPKFKSLDMYESTVDARSSEFSLKGAAVYTDGNTSITGDVHFYGTPTFHNGANGLNTGGSGSGGTLVLTTVASTQEGAMWYVV